ncbi:MAG TPA: hypothetical protein VGQ09_06410 [Chitinophagaceae bacterium]|jgi:hypothetical protein|nr:hypothetical protein [Chitinophagaceae bacterium]
MPNKRNRSNQGASDKDRPGATNRGRSFPEKPFDTNENLHNRYEGYDEKRSSFNPEYEEGFDVDENDINQRKGEYEHQKKNMRDSKTNARKKND